MDDIKEDLRDIKGHVLKLVEQGAIHNTLLAEHEKRSTNLESIVLPMHRKMAVAERVARFCGAVLAGIAIKLIVDKLKIFL